jgi:NNP family nitrate/nitrite transporter-like MFS transporter
MVDYAKSVDAGTRARPVERNRTSISEWNPEDEKFWESTGKYVARRNLNWSWFALHHGFAIWLIWSIVVTKLPQAGFHYTTDELFSLVAMPGLMGSLARFPYGFMPAIVGGRNWTVIATALLFIPVLSLAYFVTQPDTPFWLMLIVTATAGFGGGTFSGSMANMSFFFPARLKGYGLGMNAGLGNLGVSVVQLIVPLLLGFGFINLYMATPAKDGTFLTNAGLLWIPTLTIATIGAFLFMNNLSVASASFKDQMVILKRKQNWVMSYIYIGTFGSFIGYSAAFPLLIKTQFPAYSVGLAFLGPLVGSVIRPVGGIISDKVGGAKVTFWVFIGMCVAVLGVMYFVEQKNFAGFLTMFLALFTLTGLGNGSTYMSIPAIFRAQSLSEAQGKDEAARARALKAAGLEAGAALGFIGAVGSVGGFLIPRGFGASIAATGGPYLALEVFLAFYITCICLNWWYYMRKSTIFAKANV